MLSKWINRWTETEWIYTNLSTARISIGFVRAVRCECVRYASTHRKKLLCSCRMRTTSSATVNVNKKQRKKNSKSSRLCVCVCVASVSEQQDLRSHSCYWHFQLSAYQASSGWNVYGDCDITSIAIIRFIIFLGWCPRPDQTRADSLL